MFERFFEDRGLPANIRSDNGVPFASAHALFNPSKLADWWLLSLPKNSVIKVRTSPNLSNFPAHRALAFAERSTSNREYVPCPSPKILADPEINNIAAFASSVTGGTRPVE